MRKYNFNKLAHSCSITIITLLYVSLVLMFLPIYALLDHYSDRVHTHMGFYTFTVITYVINMAYIIKFKEKIYKGIMYITMIANMFFLAVFTTIFGSGLIRLINKYGGLEADRLIAVIYLVIMSFISIFLTYVLLKKIFFLKKI